VIGHGSAWAAISFVNALPTGTGASGAISLSAHARVELAPAAGAVGAFDLPPASDTPLVRRGLLESLHRLEPDETFDVSIEIDSAIPVGRGLKSSSALGVSIYRAVASAVRRPIGPEDAARFSAELGRAVGLSATGAFDDAITSASGGLVVAETESARILRHDAPDPDWRCVLWIPHPHHPPSPDWLDRFRARSAEARAGVDAAKGGRYLVAMERNTELVEGLLGYDYRPLRRELRRQGALGAGVTGMGPALAAIALARDAPKVGRAMPVGHGEVQTVEFVPPGSVPTAEAIA
jgi:shikimate kinase